jgi:capsid protein
VKEATAAKLRIDMNVSTLEDECAEQGKDWREVLAQRANEQKEIERLGLTPPAPVAAPGAPQQDAPQADDDEEDDDADEKPAETRSRDNPRDRAMNHWPA